MLHPHDNTFIFSDPLQAIRQGRCHQAVITPGLQRILQALKDALADASVFDYATKVIFLVTNILLAQSENDSSAEINKTSFDVVPEPSGLVILMLGCWALLGRRSRRRG